jgi:PAS domain S-box-containing protein
MALKGSSIQQKLMHVILLTCTVVLLLTCSALFINEFITFRKTSIRELSILGEIIGANSTAALTFDDSEAAGEILLALKAEPQIKVAGIYTKEGELFSRFPFDISKDELPVALGEDGFLFKESHLQGFVPILQNSKRLGTLYLNSDMSFMYQRFRLYGGITLIVIMVSLFLAFLLSRNLQRQISTPILALAGTAKAISDRQDYSVRAQKHDEDEIGLLTEAFNHMLTRIEEQTHALNESSVKLHAVVNSAMSAVIVLDAKGIITDWNKRAEDMFGWMRTEAIGKELASTIIPENFRAAHRRGLEQYLRTGEGAAIDKLHEFTALRREGSEFPIELSISVLRTGAEISFCGFITDITERKRAETEIKLFNQKLSDRVAERTQELEVVNQELESFSYSVSHDLRAPLRSIHGYMNILAEEYENLFDEEAKRLIDIILKNGEKMGQLIDDLLAFSRLGRKALIKSLVSMDDIVQTLVEEQQSLVRHDSLSIRVLPLPPAYGDHSTIQQIWVNLISNAIKYSRHKEKIVIEIGSLKPDRDVYYVKDNGAGFDMDYYDKLFGVFQRLHSEADFEGTGVGLAIVNRIVTKHGGKIWAEAKVNEGATFFFSLGNDQDNGPS